ncbi:uncharacterized protein LOC108100228 [Drosophila ficusphila]|uniref:uncharacterized protein LOC108100228 n=1 Tax=Drosophila ficusphila TaxID=30025 RepID=UPI0007E7F069|nr:uncharacterized protein LOC108100228 [Drosophila ficusphila]
MADLFSSMLPSSYYPESNDARDSSSHSGHLMPDAELISSLIPYLYPLPTLQMQQRSHSNRSNLESSPLSDDEKHERIRLQELMRNQVHIDWENEPVEAIRNEPPRDRSTDSDAEVIGFYP